jgi:hypothetical protein
MLSKCANPECSEIFRYLYEGKIFCLAPTPEIEIAQGIMNPALHERFWLCARCSKEMTLTWGGTQVKVVRPAIQKEVPKLPPKPEHEDGRIRPRVRARAAYAGREDR